MPKNTEDQKKSVVDSQKKEAMFTFFSRLPDDSIQEEVLGDLSLTEMSRVAMTSRGMNELALKSSSDYKAILEGQRKVEAHFKGCECDFIVIPALPEEMSLKDYLLNVPSFTANAAFALVTGQHLVLRTEVPTELDVQNMKSQEVLVYFEEEKFKYIVKNGAERIRGEVELQLEDPIVEDNGQVSGYIIHRQGIRKKYYDELKEGIEKLRARENFIPSAEAIEAFFKMPEERKHIIVGATLFYVDKLNHSISDDLSFPNLLEKMIQKFGSIAPNIPVQISEQELVEIRASASRSWIHDHLKIKKAFLCPSVLMSIGKEILTIEQALKLYHLCLLRAGTSKEAFYALENGLLTVSDLITPPVPPPPPEGMVYLQPELLAMTYLTGHRAVIETLLSPLGLRALERKLITVSSALEFVNDTRGHDSYDTGSSFRVLLSNETVMHALEQGWLTLKSAARLSSTILGALLTLKGLELLQLIHEGEEQLNPQIRLSEVIEFRWSYQLGGLLKNPHFIPALRERKIRFPQLTEIDDEKSRDLILSPAGLKALEKGYFTTSHVDNLRDAAWLTLLLSSSGMKAFGEGFINMESLLGMIRDSRHIEREADLYRNLSFLLSDEGFFLLNDRYTSLEVAAEINGLYHFVTPALHALSITLQQASYEEHRSLLNKYTNLEMSAARKVNHCMKPSLAALKEILKEKWITMEDMHHISVDDDSIVTDLLSAEGIRKLREDKTFVQSIITRQNAISTKSIPLLEEISDRNAYYLQQLRNIQTGMDGEYGTAQNEVSYLIFSLNKVSEMIDSHRLDHSYLVKKMSMTHQIQPAFDRIKKSISDCFVQNAIRLNRFPSSVALNALISEFDQDPVARDSIPQIYRLEQELRELRTREHQALNLDSEERYDRGFFNR